MRSLSEVDFVTFDLKSEFIRKNIMLLINKLINLLDATDHQHSHEHLCEIIKENI